MEWYISLKRGRQSFHHSAMQWHHRPGTKKLADLANLAKRGSRKRVLDEIAKCDLLCANCHAVRTYWKRRRGDDDQRLVA